MVSSRWVAGAGRRLALAVAIALATVTVTGCGGTSIASLEAGLPSASSSLAPASAVPSHSSIASGIPTATASATSTPATPSPAPSPTASPLLGPGDFTTPVPPAADAPWTGIRWHKLGPNDLLGQIQSVLRWRGGFVALGENVDDGASARTPVWTSSDGATWRALDASVFGPNTIVIGVVETPGGLVALSVGDGTNDCAPDPGCWTLGPPVRSWTSPDGTAWTSHDGPAWKLPTDGSLIGPDIAAGPSGVVATVSYPNDVAHVAVSADGTAWQTVPKAVAPHVTIAAVAGFAGGFVAAGTLGLETDNPLPRAFWSSDGKQWTTTVLHSGVEFDGIEIGFGQSLLVATKGVRLVGGYPATPSGPIWWQSSNGRSWQLLKGYPPLGVWNGEGEGSGMVPNGELAANGERFVGYRTGNAPRAWASFDGDAWQKLSVDGALPSETAYGLIALPGGLLIRDDTTTWFGEAITH